MTKRNKISALMVATIMITMALLLGFSIWLGNKIAGELFANSVIIMGVEGMLAYIILLIIVIFILLFLSCVLALLFHKKFNIFKKICKIYGM